MSTRFWAIFAFSLAIASLFSPSLANAEWVEKRTTKGCVYYVRDSVSSGPITWSSPCRRGEPINGEGVMRAEGRPWYEWKLTMIDGVSNGPTSIRSKDKPEFEPSWEMNYGCAIGANDKCVPKRPILKETLTVTSQPTTLSNMGSIGTRSASDRDDPKVSDQTPILTPLPASGSAQADDPKADGGGARSVR